MLLFAISMPAGRVDGRIGDQVASLVEYVRRTDAAKELRRMISPWRARGDSSSFPDKAPQLACGPRRERHGDGIVFRSWPSPCRGMSWGAGTASRLIGRARSVTNNSAGARVSRTAAQLRLVQTRALDGNRFDFVRSPGSRTHRPPVHWATPSDALRESTRIRQAETASAKWSASAGMTSMPLPRTNASA